MVGGVHLRKAVLGDEQALSIVGSATFLETFAGALDGADVVSHCRAQHSPEIYAGWLADAEWDIWLAETEVGGAPAGYLVLGPAALPGDVRPDDLEIKRIYVLRPFQGGGAGRELIHAASSRAEARGAKRLMLGVYGKNERAIGFYQRMGFTVHGTRRFRVGDREYDDLVLQLLLSNA